MRCTAQEVFDKLMNDDKILTLEGRIKFFFGDVDIIIMARG